MESILLSTSGGSMLLVLPAPRTYMSHSSGNKQNLRDFIPAPGSPGSGSASMLIWSTWEVAQFNPTAEPNYVSELERQAEAALVFRNIWGGRGKPSTWDIMGEKNKMQNSIQERQC